MELWALKRLLGTPKTTPTAGIMYITGSLFTSLRIDLRQLLYLQKILKKEEIDWGRTILMLLKEEDIGWAKQISSKLQEYHLEMSWNDIKEMSSGMWKNKVT